MKKIYSNRQKNFNISAETLVSKQANNISGTLETFGDEIPDRANNQSEFKRKELDKMSKEYFQPAIYSKAIEYRNSRSYFIKSGDKSYKSLPLFSDTEELKYFGIGIYFYIEFFRRIMWLMFALFLIQSITIYINFEGNGLSNYSSSFSTYLIKTTLGNYSGNKITQFDGLITVGAPALSFLAIFIFYLIWKAHFYRTISQGEEQNKDVKPERFCLEIEGLDKSYINEEELYRFFSNFGPVYEVSIARRHKNKLSYFQELDQIQEEIKEEELEVLLNNGDEKKIAKLKEAKQKINKEISGLEIEPITVSAFIHFQFQKTRSDCLNYFSEHYLHSTCRDCCMRTCCCCCVKELEPKYTFRGQKLYIKSEKVPAPEDINWQSFEITFCSKILRIFFAFIIIVVFLAISCTIIGLCSLYISSHSDNCDSIDTNSYSATSAAATGSDMVMRCFCNANLVSSFTDSTIKTACSSYLESLYIQQAIQYVVIITSSITNYLFGFIVEKLVNCVRPGSQSSALLYKTAIYTLFIVINSIIIPILIYANVFGFQASNYVSLLTLISTDIKNVLLVSNLSFYQNFTVVWYRNVSPIFTNFIIINTVVVWVFFIVDKCLSNKQSLQSDEGKILQKHMNKDITSYKVNVYKEAANFYLILIMVCLLCTGIPVLLPLGFLNILSRYITNRSLLQNNSSRVDGLGADFSSFSLSVLTIILVLFPLFGEWMLTANNYIYPSIQPYGINLSLNWFDGTFQILEKEMYLPFYIGISGMALLQWVAFHTIIRFCTCICSSNEKKAAFHSRPFNEYVKGMNILVSYNIRNNDEMRNAILHLEKYMIQKAMI